MRIRLEKRLTPSRFMQAATPIASVLLTMLLGAIIFQLIGFDGPHAIYETRMYRGLRAMIQWCVDHRVKVVVATEAAGGDAARAQVASAWIAESSGRCCPTRLSSPSRWDSA